MKLSKREKTLIIILIIVGLVYLSHTFVIKGEFFNLETLREEYKDKNAKYNTISQNIVLKSKYEASARELMEEINSLDVLSDLQQEKVIVFLNNYLANTNLDVSNMSFTDKRVVSINSSVVEELPKDKGSLEIMMDNINNNLGPNDTEETAETPQGDSLGSNQDNLSVKAMTVYIVFEGTYENMINFIDAIQNQQYDISITDINITSSDENIIQGNMSLNFYEVPKLDTFIEENQDWVWKYLTPIRDD